MTRNPKFRTRMDDYLDKYLESQEKKEATTKGDTTVQRDVNKELEPTIYTNVNFVWLNGRQQAFNYNYMVSVEFTPLETGNRIMVTLTTHKITITGFSLHELHHDLRNRYVNEIEQADEDLVHMIQDETPIIIQIEVQAFH